MAAKEFLMIVCDMLDGDEGKRIVGGAAVDEKRYPGNDWNAQSNTVFGI